MQTKRNTKSAPPAKSAGAGFRLVDFFIIVIFLCIAAISVNLFRLDLLQTIDARNAEPVGIVVVKKNTVQRRLSDRVLWGRLSNESPIYMGDLIRVAEISSAVLNIDNNSIDLNENTLIRISRAEDGEGMQIILSEGNLSVAAGNEDRAITLELNGRQVQASQGTVINVASRESSVSVQVNEGTVQFIDRGNVR